MPSAQSQQQQQDSWDPNAFEQQVEDAPNGKWKESPDEKKAASRLQDLSLGLSSSHDPPPKKEANESWPYESSPCKWNGGKNTRPGGEEINKELFDPEFANNHQTESSFGFDDTDSEQSFGEDIHEPSREDVEKNNDTKRNVLRRSASYREGKSRSSETRPSTLAQYQRGSQQPNDYSKMLAWNQRRESERDLEECAEEETAPASSNHRSSSRRNIYGEQKKNELDSASHHARMESKRSKKKSSSPKDELPSSTFHGPVSHSRAAPTTSSRRPGPSRSKSSDGAELCAATLHGRTSVSRVRNSSRRSGSSKTSKPTDRRAMLKRGMSTANVKRPEEYGPHRGDSGTGGGDANPKGDLAKRKTSGRSRMMLQRSSSKQCIEEDSVLPPRSNKAEQGEEMMEHTAPSSDCRKQQRQRMRNPEPKRNLLVLLKEKKKVKIQDLQDKENRRLLHTVMYQHKLNMSLEELHKHIVLEQQGRRSPPRRQRLLYV